MGAESLPGSMDKKFFESPQVLLALVLQKFITGLIFFVGIGVVADPQNPKSPVQDWEKKIWRSYVVLDFESGEFTEKNWRFRGAKEQALPEIRTTQNITAPLPGSRRALLFRFHEANNYAGQFIFPEPVEFRENLKELVVPVYSSKSSGSLSLVFQTHDYENFRIFLTQLNFRGWKYITLPLRGRLNQNDPVLDSRLSVRLVGILYEPGGEINYGKEILVGIDDITAVVREKYKLLPNPESLLE